MKIRTEIRTIKLSPVVQIAALIGLMSAGACASTPTDSAGDSLDSTGNQSLDSGSAAHTQSEDAKEEPDPQEAIAAAVPDTDIFVFRIDPDSAQIVTSFVANVTSRVGYDNQPKYIPGTNDFLFSSILDGKQSDVYRYSEIGGSLTQVTNTDLSEYSPTPLENAEFSTVVVEADGTQRLWRYSDEGEGVEPVRKDVTGIGYHAWLPKDQLGVFIVDQPLMHLDVITSQGEGQYTLAVNPGRSLHARPGSGDLSFVQHRSDESSRLMSWNGETITYLVDMPKGVEDMTWLPDGRALTVVDGSLMSWRVGELLWTEVADLGEYLPGAVTRLAVNESATRLAIVSSMQVEQESE